MGIQTIIKSIKQKIGLKKAVEKGKELESKGTTLVPTTSGYVEVSKSSPLVDTSRGSSSKTISSSSGSRGDGGSSKTTPVRKTPPTREPINNIQPMASTSVTQVQINPQTNKPYGYVTQAPTKKQQYSTSVKERGYIKGTLYYGGQKVSGLFSSSNISPVKDSGYQAPVGKLGSSTIEVAPYFTPVGSALLVGGGVEELGTSSGRTRIKEKVEYLEEEKGYSPTTAKIISYGQPIAEVGLGSIGVRSQFKGIQASQETKLFEASPTGIKAYRIEGTTSGIDVGVGYKVTKPNLFQRQVLRIKPKEYLTTYKQPFYKVTSDSGKTSRIVSESGEGITYSLSGKKLTATKFKTFGRSESGKVLVGKNNIKFTPEKLQGSVGRAVVETSKRTSGKIKYGYDPIKDNFKFSFKGKTTPLKTTTSSTVGVTSSEQNKIINFAGGKVSKVRVYNQGGVSGITKIKDIKTFGTIERLTPSTSTKFNSGLGKVVKQIPKTTSKTSGFEVGVEVGMKTGTTSSVSSFKATPVPSKQFNLPALKEVNYEKVKENYATTPKLVSLTEQIVEQKQRSSFGSSSGQVPFQRTESTQTPKTTTAIITIPKLRNEPIQTSSFRNPTFITPTNNVPSTPFVPLGFLPFAFKGERMKGLKDIKSKRTYKYFPSFKALAFNIRRKGKLPSPTKRWTGFEVRPIYFNDRKKRRKKKK